MLDPATLAAIGTLLGVGLELVHQSQKIHSLTSPKKKRTKRKKRPSEGYAYVVQDVDYSKKFLIGRAGGNVNWLTQLNAKYPGKLVPVLVIPTTSTEELERELNSLCATHLTDGDWFELTPAQIRRLRQLQVVVDLTAGNLVSVDQELDPDALEQAKRLFELISNASADTGQDEDTAVVKDASTNLDLKIVPINNYWILPKLKLGSGYLLVVRDVEHGLHRIDSANDPARYVDEALGLVNPRFGLELILALESKRFKQVAENLAILYPPVNESGWRQLSAPQLQEIRNLASPRAVQKTIYVTPKTHWGLETVRTADYREVPRLRYPDGYVCITQGVKSGKRYKIWHTTKPKDLVDDLRLVLMLNNPHDAATTSEPTRFACVIKTKHATAFKAFLHKRYAEFRRGGDWFDLDKLHLKEISAMTNQQ